jgi:hypothetical protein
MRCNRLSILNRATILQVRCNARGAESVAVHLARKTRRRNTPLDHQQGFSAM